MSSVRQHLLGSFFVIIVMSALLTSGCGKGKQMETGDGEVARGGRCQNVTPVSVPAMLQPAPFVLPQFITCVPAAECNTGSVFTRSRIGNKFCESNNQTLCSNNDDCLGNRDCRGRVPPRSTTDMVTLTSAQPGTACSGGVNCVVDAQINANTQLACGCACESQAVP
jgi:hypothetical protein